MPDWVVQVLVQFPIVVVIGLVAWYANKRIEKNSAEAIRRDQVNRETALADLKEAHRQTLARLDAEIAWLRGAVKDEFKTLGKKVDELTTRLGG